MRDQLPRLEKKLAEQQTLLEKTTENLLLLTRAFGVLEKPENKVGENYSLTLEVFTVIASHINYAKAVSFEIFVDE